MKLGLIGLGTVGAAVVSVLQKNSDHIFEKTGIQLELKKVSDTDPSKKKFALLANSEFALDAKEVINDPSISTVIEAIGGINPALDFVTTAIKNGKNVVTSNKELIAKHGEEIFKLADEKNVKVLFEAAVCGGIPILNQIRTSLVPNKIEEIYGIVNGTTNYILSKMTHDKIDFDSALKDAQMLGFAEADPKNDIEGYDALYKAAILAKVAFGASLDLNNIFFEGISKITLEDIKYAGELGYAIKLLAIIKKHEDDNVEIRVHPSLINIEHPLASVNDAFNAIYVKGNAVGEVMFYGKGAGGRPTASSILSDVIEITSSKGTINYPKKFGIKIKDINECENSYYIKLLVKDQAGVLADIAGVFAKENVSIKEVLQKETLDPEICRGVDNIATVVIITHRVKERNVSKSLKIISGIQSISKIGNVIRVGMG